MPLFDVSLIADPYLELSAGLADHFHKIGP